MNHLMNCVCHILRIDRVQVRMHVELPKQLVFCYVSQKTSMEIFYISKYNHMRTSLKFFKSVYLQFAFSYTIKFVKRATFPMRYVNIIIANIKLWNSTGLLWQYSALAPVFQAISRIIPHYAVSEALHAIIIRDLCIQSARVKYILEFKIYIS